MVKLNKNVISACFSYKTGIVLIQGSGCGEWETKDMPDINCLLSDDNIASSSVDDSCASCDTSSVKDTSQDTPPTASFSARSLLLAANNRLTSFLNLSSSGLKSKDNKKSPNEKDIADQLNVSAASSLTSISEQCTLDLIAITQDKNMLLASTPIQHQENILELNSTTKKKTTPTVASEEEQILEFLQRDETNSLYDNLEYNPECSSIKGSPDCD